MLCMLKSEYLCICLRVCIFLAVCEIEGQIFLQCGSECPPVCGENKTICSDKCVMGCQCPPGTFLHRGSERCVTECPPGMM